MKSTFRFGFALLIAIILSDLIFSGTLKAQSQQDLAKNENLHSHDFSVSTDSLLKDSAENDPSDFVADYENIYTPSQLQFIKRLIANFNSENPVHITLVTFDMSMITKNDSSKLGYEFSPTLYDNKNDKHSLLIKICFDQRMMQIQCADKTKNLISLSKSRKIINTAFIPYFKRNRVFEGSLYGLNKLMKELSSKKISEIAGEE
jgi:uncharacterized membrane protein YgcG